MARSINAMSDSERRRIHVQGVVQGVGFRPFVYGLAVRHQLKGFVSNQSDGVHIEIEGPRPALDAFERDLKSQPPPLARLDTITIDTAIPIGDLKFVIHESESLIGRATSISPDVATCDDCLRELFDPADRRYRYPFINCTNCGPRYTIIKDIPYDRPFTTMADFPMCSACSTEYYDPLNRRFHAQPNACPVCGPKVWLYPGEPEGETAIHAAQEQLSSGKIVAIKGIGGFHLACDATNTKGVAELRRRKNRGDKPFGLMAKDLDQIRLFAEVNSQEADQLMQRQRPITLLRRKANSALSPEVAPGTVLVGFMLPYSPLHHLILNDRPLVMTSGNLSDDPICRDNDEAKVRLGGLADSFLLHNRDIHVVCDDSVVRIGDWAELPIRRARGYAPLPVKLGREVETILAVGAELKSTFCLTKGEYAYLSPHIGDMENLETLRALERGLAHFRSIFRCDPNGVVCDLHPGYLSTRWAQEFAKTNNLPLLQVQHHHAHVASLMAEHGRSADKVIGISLDGTGYGTDGAVWGGEILVANYASFKRVAHLKYVPLPGGDTAIKKPYRMALVHLLTAGVNWSEDLPCVKAVDRSEQALLRRQLDARINCVDTSSMGRLFDAVASLLGICHHSTYEGQAAVELEMAATSVGAEAVSREAYRIDLVGDNPTILDPTNLVRSLVADFRSGIPPDEISARFHYAIADCIVDVCSQIREQMGISVVALTGGVFQNVLLLELSKVGLVKKGFQVLTHRIVPPNDGGISLGQALIGLTH